MIKPEINLELSIASSGQCAAPVVSRSTCIGCKYNPQKRKKRRCYKCVNFSCFTDVVNDSPSSMFDWNTLSLDDMVEYLRKKYLFSSTGDAKCIYHLIEFYDKHK